MTRIEKVSIKAEDIDILPKERVRNAPPMEGRHDKFQFGTNPMEMTAFEKSLLAKEKFERDRATEKYVKGIQGKDGGAFPHEQNRDNKAILPLNVKSTY